MKKFLPILLGLGLAAMAGVQAQSAAPATTDANAPVLTLPTTTAAAPANASSTDAAPASTAPSVPPAITPIAVPSDPTGAFNAGLASYAAGNFDKARGHFLTAEHQAVTPALEYNFGNACYSAGDYGEAILHYLRSLSLNPDDPDARQNLAMARQALNIAEPELTRLDRYAGTFTENAWMWVATVAGWAAIYLAFLPQLYRWGGATPKLLCGALALVAIGAGIGAWGVKQHDRDGVVLHPDTPLKLSPTAESGAIGMAQAGEMAQVLDEHGDYYKVLTTDGHMGWVNNSSYAPVWD